SADTLLIEDTYYTDGAEVDRQALHKRIDEYAAQRGWSIVEDIRQEKGSLPLLLSGDFKTMWRGAAPQGGGVPIGLRAGLFHPITGYSLPASSRTAVALAKITGPLTTRRVMETVEDMARRHFRRTWYDRMLNRQLFLAGKPEHRHRIMSRFHKLPQPLIERFYAGRLPPAYQLRILFGKPPVPIMGAMKALPERAALQAR
ncbi:MAG: lycopene cyclase family protein, partial [Pseudomonadota bacterium]